MKLKLFIKVFLSATLIFTFTVILNSLLYTTVIQVFGEESIAWTSRRMAASIQEEVIRGYLGAYILIKFFGKNNIKRIPLRTVSFIIAIIFTGVEKHSMLKTLITYFQETYLFNTGDLGEELYKVFILALSIIMHAAIHFILISCSILAAVQKRYVLLLFIGLIHACINYAMIVTPIKTGIWSSLELNTLVKLLIFFLLCFLVVIQKFITSKNREIVYNE